MMKGIMSEISAAVLPLLMLAVSAVILCSRGRYFDSFLSGAREGMSVCFRLLPSLCALIVAVEMFFASGIAELLSDAISRVTDAVGIPSEIIPLLLTRPVSGSASSATYAELLEKLGADSFPALCASVIMGSSDTIIYIISVYCSSVGIRKTRHAFPAAFSVMIFCVIFSCFLCRMFFL